MRVMKLSLLTMLCVLGAQLLPSAPLDPGSYTQLAATFTPATTVSINTTTLAMTGGATFTGVNSGGVCVFCFGSVNVGAVTFNVTGTRPLAILSQSTMTWGGTINSSAATSTAGPGGFNGAIVGGNGSGPGPGAGNTNGGSGGAYGGNGGDSGFGTLGGTAYGSLLTTLQGGSGGGRSTFFAVSQDGGGGGGAVELGSSGVLTISATAVINAVGGAGGDFMTGGQDGGGGGAGGGILLHGSSGTVSISALLNANGGRGGNVAGGTRICEGGGGGGGRIHLVNMTGNGTTNVAGGLQGTGGGGGTAGLPGTVTSSTSNNPPTLSSVAPAVGPVAGGQSVTLTGTNFTGTTSVTFGGAPATGVTVVSPTSITATTPPHVVGAVSVIVTNTDGSNAANTLYTYQAGPTVSSVSPNSGTTAGGTNVTITGTDFTGATNVTFGGSAATTFTVVSSTSITATTPPHAAGAVSIVVTTPSGNNTPNLLFTYNAPASAPTLTSVSPSSGPVAGGQNVTLTGTNFTGATAVTFGGAPATAVTVVSATSITATTPSHLAGAVSVIVTTPGGSNAANTLYTYQAAAAAPTVTGVSPSSGPTTGGTTVTITGTDFTGATSVTFGGSPATLITVNNSTNISATTPPHAAGPVSVIVTTPAGSNTPNTLFTYVTPAAPEMDVSRGLTPIPVVDGGVDSLGAVPFGAAQTVTYTITNSGNAALNLTGTPNLVTATAGTNVSSVFVTTQPPVSTIAPAGTVSFTINYTVAAAGAFDFSVNIPNNDADEGPYNWTASGIGSTVPEMSVVRGTADIDDGCFDSVGNVPVGTAASFTYTIYNTGNADLTIVNPVNLLGAVNCTIAVTTQPTSPVGPSDSTTLVISVTPTAPGIFTCVISIGNNDPDENPYDWTLIGAGPGIASGGSPDVTDDNGNCSTGETGQAWMLLAGMVASLGFALRLRRRVA